MWLLASSAFVMSAHAELPSLRPLQTLSPLSSEFNEDSCPAFGYAVAVSGDIALVGMPRTAGVGTGDPHDLFGRVAVYSRGADRVWKRTGTLLGHGGLFGSAISFRGAVAAIASSYDVHIFKFQSTTRKWTLLRRLIRNVDISSIDYQDGRLVVSGSGAAEVYQIDTAGNVLRQSRLTASTDIGEAFGADVAMAGDTIVVGAPNFVPGAPDQPGPGAAYVFKLIDGQWRQRQKLVPPDPQEPDTFGFSVAIDKGMIIVGSPGGAPLGAGYVYTPEAGIWKLRTKLHPTLLQEPSYSSFGLHIAMFDTRVAVTAVSHRPPPTPGDLYSAVIFAYERSGSDLRVFAVARPESGLRIAGPGQPVSIFGMTLVGGSPLAQCGIAITYDLRQSPP